MLTTQRRHREMDGHGMEATATSGPQAAPQVQSNTQRAWLDRITIGAIGVIVVLVTIPHVERLARRDNEMDAMRTLRLLALQPAAPGTDARTHSLAQMVGGDRLLARRLEDVEWMHDGRLRRHGYLFDIARSADGSAVLRAWPVEAGVTGRAAFLWSPMNGLRGHDNVDLAWGGERAPSMEDARGDGWVALPKTKK